MSFEIKVNEYISLKIPTVTDAETVFGIVNKNREHLRQWLDWVDKTNSPEDSKKNILQRQEGFEKKDSASFLVSHHGTWVGSVGFVDIDTANKCGEIGYWLSADFQGKGIITDCVRTLINYGFKELNLHRIVIKCSSQNTKSAGVPRRLGFTLEGRIREDKMVDGSFHDTLIFGLLDSDKVN